LGNDTLTTIAASLFPSNIFVSHEVEFQELHSQAILNLSVHDPLKNRDGGHVPRRLSIISKTSIHLQNIYSLEVNYQSLGKGICFFNKKESSGAAVQTGVQGSFLLPEVLPQQQAWFGGHWFLPFGE
jgi:hypothetical protein